MATFGHVTLGMCTGFLLLYSSGRAAAQTRGTIDTIFTTKGATTFITCGAPVSTFQIGDGKNSDYDYRIVDGNLVFIRPTVPAPRTTNLIVREGSNIHYMILTFKDKVDLGQLRYTLSARTGAEKDAGAPEAAIVKGSDGEQIPVVTEPEPAATNVVIDTVSVGKIAEDFARQQKGSRQYETKVGGISLSFSNAMILDNVAYFCYQLKNKSQQPYNLIKATLMYKDNKAAERLYTMPVLYKKGPATIGKKEEQQLVFVVPSRVFKKNDEVIVVLQNNADQKQLVLYTPVNALPKYMITQ